MIQRAGDVIPQIVEVVAERAAAGARARCRLPDALPGLRRGRRVRLEGEAVTRCPNLDCPAQLKNNLRHLAGRGALDIEGLGEKLVDQLVERGLVRRSRTSSALDAATLAGLERMGEKSAANLVAALERAKQTTLARFLLALGIRHVGEAVAELLARPLRRPRPAARRDARSSSRRSTGIGPTIAESVARFFADPRNRAEIDALRELGVRWRDERAARAARARARARSRARPSC